MRRVLEVNVADRYVTVEAGCTWAEVDAALDGTGLRPPHWGPLSGSIATVGGSLAQNGAFYGSTGNGSVADSVIGVSVVLANGTMVTTGSGGRQHAKPFTRDGGPDMTGLFVGDNGALGFKVAATLRLKRRPENVGCLSFGFSSIVAMARAQAEMSSLQGISEGFGIDRFKAEQSTTFNKPSDSAKASEPVENAGRATARIDAYAFTLHLVVEGFTPSALAESMRAVRAAAGGYGVEIAATVPASLVARPFGPVRGILGRNGERWVPVHGIFPISAAAPICEATETFLAAQAGLMQDHGIKSSIMTMTVGAEFFIEPSFYWLDEITPLHARTLGADIADAWRGRPANEKTRAMVVKIRRQIQELYAGGGAVSWQAARDYPFREAMKPETYALLQSIKRVVDPKGLMNPSALGLD